MTFSINNMLRTCLSSDYGGLGRNNNNRVKLGMEWGSVIENIEHVLLVLVVYYKLHKQSNYGWELFANVLCFQCHFSIRLIIICQFVIYNLVNSASELNSLKMINLLPWCSPK